MKVICFANQKGGTGKTLSSVNIAAGLVERGKKVLCVDFDPQGNLSDYLGFDFNEDALTITDLLKDSVENRNKLDYGAAVVLNEKENIYYIPSDINLASADMFLAGAMRREYILKRVLQKEAFGGYDYILVDCLPSLGILLINALTASDSVIVPVQMQKFALNGIIQLEEIFNMVKAELNTGLQIEGVLETMYDNTVMAKSVDETLKKRYGDLLFKNRIGRRVEASNSTCTQISLINTKGSELGRQYRSVVDEIIAREKDNNV